MPIIVTNLGISQKLTSCPFHVYCIQVYKNHDTHTKRNDEDKYTEKCHRATNMKKGATIFF